MTPEDFVNSSLDYLAQKTGIDKTRWSRYRTGKVSINHSTLEKAAVKLGMTTSSLLQGIEQCRRKSDCAKTQ